ncbi:MAG: alpha-fucosidase [Planctomycetes bacterium]|nr:alpha-fucosidase [Planctomycetota bacterium]
MVMISKMMGVAKGRIKLSKMSQSLLVFLLMATFIASGTVSATAERPPEPPVRRLKTEMGITQLSDEQMEWILDAKFGMFIHWGLYTGPGRGEWVMENEGIRPENYRAYAFPDSGDEYFDAKDYHPEQWAQLAKEAGMKWMCLTARHHDGFCLFDSPHPNAFTSQQTLGRDLFAEYVEACRDAGLKVGFYYSPLSWRYPGYYDVTGKNMLPNKFNYPQDPANKENARIMKEENYVNVKKLLTDYGPIDYIYWIYWDGGWLGQRGSDADGAYFHESGKYLDPDNVWPIPAQYWDIEEATGKPLGIMGMVRKYHPHAVTNPRYGWVGDMTEEEGRGETKGPIRYQVYQDKNMSILQSGIWGYDKRAIAENKSFDIDQLIQYFANCVVRNMTYLLNITPDSHGAIPEVQQQRLLEMGAWLRKTGDAIYGTRGGPWQPVDSQYGYTYKDATVFAHLLKAYAGDTFTVPPMGTLKVKKVYDVYTGKPLPYELHDGSVEVRNLDRKSSPADTIIAVVYDQPVVNVWQD